MSPSHELIGGVGCCPFFLDHHKVPQIGKLLLADQFSVLKNKIKCGFELLLIILVYQIVNYILVKTFCLTLLHSFQKDKMLFKVLLHVPLTK